MDVVEVVDRLRAAGCVFAEDEAAVLVDAAGEDPERLAAMVRDRCTGTPLEHVVGWAEFCGLRVAVGPGVFVPRRRTEVLVRRAASLAGPDAAVVDMCCGSGAVGLAIATKVPGARVHACDIDPVAVRWARQNLRAVRGHVHRGDLFDPLPHRLRGRVDLVVANAPYVPTGALPLMPSEARDHEPRVALDGGPDGVDVHRRIAAGATGWLAPGGAVVIETSRAQADLTARSFRDRGFVARVEHDPDLDGTVVTATRSAR